MKSAARACAATFVILLGTECWLRGQPIADPARMLAEIHAARGGAQRLAAIKALRLRGGSQVTTVVLPRSYRIDTQTARGTMTVGFDGRRLWRQWPPGLPVPPSAPGGDETAASQAALSNLARYYLTYLSRPFGALRARVDGTRAFGPVSGRTLAFHSEGESRWWVVMADDGLPAAVVWRMRDSLDGPETGYAMSRLADYRAVGGVKFPMTAQYMRIDKAGKLIQSLMTETLTTIEVNPALPPDFMMPR